MFMMATLIFIPILASIILYKTPLRIAKVCVWLVQLVIAFFALRLFLASAMDNKIIEILGGHNSVLYILLAANRLSLVFVCLSILFFSLMFLYTTKDKFYTNKLIMLMLVLQGVINGLFLTNDIFNLFVLFEVSTVVLVLLVMFKDNRTYTYNGIYFLIIQVLSMTFFLFGLAYIYRIFGVLSIDVISERMPLIDKTSLIMPVSFMFAGLFVKLGAFPLFSWVSISYSALSTPIVVQAIQSGLFIKTTVFVFARFAFMFSPSIDYSNLFLAICLISSIVGFVKALSQKNLILILAFHTVSQVGLMCAGFFLSEKGYWGGMYHSINHAFFKTILFLAAGIVITKYQTTDITMIKGVLKNMPFVGVMIIVGILGITGAPFFNGSISKYMIMDGNYFFIINAALWLINMGTILSFTKFSKILFGNSDLVDSKVDIYQQVSMLILAILILIGGIFGTSIMSYLFESYFYVSLNGYIEKGLIYLVMMVIGYFFYKYVLSKSDILYKNLSGSLSLSNTTFMLVIVFVVLILYGYVI
jgi:multicomponent Na+:H+ antiporter subunit D